MALLVVEAILIKAPPLHMSLCHMSDECAAVLVFAVNVFLINNYRARKNNLYMET